MYEETISAEEGGADLDLGETSTGLPPRRALFVGSVNVKINGELSHELSTLRN